MTRFGVVCVIFACSFWSLESQSVVWKTIELDVVAFDGTIWTEAIVLKRIAQINRVFHQCGVRVLPTPLQKISPPTGEVNLYRDLDVQGSGGLRAAATAMGLTSRLTLIYIRQFQEGTVGTAGIPAQYSARFPQMVNRAWVTEEIFQPTYLEPRDPGYVTEAHELAHILLNRSHLAVGQKGLMAATPEDVNGHLSEDECTTIRNSMFTH